MYALIALMEVKMRTKSDIDKAYKFNGVTHNVSEWYKKEINRLFPNRLIQDEVKFYSYIKESPEISINIREFKKDYEQNIADSHDITKSTMGFE